MNPRDFIAKWGEGGPAFALNERAGAQSHFIDLCHVLDVPTPGSEDYCFEKGLTKTGSTRARTDGFADVWKRGAFAWEYKAPGRPLEPALQQLMLYALPLDNPPLLVVSDRLRIEVHSHFTGTPSEKHVWSIEDLASSEHRAKLRAFWQNPEAFKPRRTTRDITEQAALTFAATAERMRAAGVPGEQVSHFLSQALFCFFAEDVGLLPGRLFERLVSARLSPEKMRGQLANLFATMREGGLFGVDDIPWFNGGLFKEISIPELCAADIEALREASALNWSAIDPSIFGTLFERGLDPSKRSALGAHYTDPATIERLIEPVVRRPLREEWQQIRARIEAALAKSKKHGDKAWREATDSFNGFLERLRNYRLLDPACGSGNFLYLGLKALKDLEHEVNLDAEALGLQRQHDVTGPHNVLGIELNEYAAELARVTVWIGELQWRLQHGYGFNENPVLQPLDHIECRDALLDGEGREREWPAADSIIGNPPFVGNKKMRRELGDDYTDRLRSAYQDRVPGGADLVCFWFEKARALLEVGHLHNAGLVTTNSIRGGQNRVVLDRICETSRIFEAWSDEHWVNDGAAVRVSLVAFGTSRQSPMLDGKAVHSISPDLTGEGEAQAGLNLTLAGKRPENAGTCFMGVTKVGPFDIEGATARSWLQSPNPNGKSNAAVLRPSWNGLDVTRRPRDVWIVDFGCEMPEEDAALFEDPYEYALGTIKPFRATNNRASYRDLWWRHGEPRPALRALLAPLPRYIVTPEVSKHRLFAFAPAQVLPDKNLQVIARADDATFGILHSRLHELWALRMGSSLEDRPRYTPTSTFEPFPFPAGLTPADTAHQRTEPVAGGALIPAALDGDARPHAEAIARAAHRLHTLREAWLNPPDWTVRSAEVVPLGMENTPYPERIAARPGFEAQLAKRTLTNLYNAPPAWLKQAHEALDRAVAAAYGWSDYTQAMGEDEILRRLLALNLAHSTAPGAASRSAADRAEDDAAEAAEPA